MLQKNLIRIKALVNLIPPEQYIADIGTDHGFLAIFYLQQNPTSFAYLIDINDQPLKNAAHNLRKYHINPKRYQLIQTNGFNNWDDPKVTVAVLAGLGSTLITTILQQCPANITTLIIATNNNPLKIRQFCQDRSWKIVLDDLLVENQIFYSLLKIVRSESATLLSNEQITFGVNYQKQRDNPLFRTYWWEQQIHYERILAKINPKNVVYQQLIAKIRSITKLLGQSRND